MKIGYYPGCSAESIGKEYDLSVRVVAPMLGIELVELPDWSCCGASSGHYISRQLSLALPARNLALAERAGLGLAVICPACFLRFKQTNHELQANDRLRQEVQEIIGVPYSGNVAVRHILDIFCREVGLPEIQRRVTKSLNGLKVVAYYGCYLVRPPRITQFDDPENPTLMDELLRTLGAEVLDWSYKVECCGGNLVLSRADITNRLVRDIVRAANETGAAAIVTACPLCQANLDMRQLGPRKLPVFYFSELMALALGMEPRATRSWWQRHITSPQHLLKSQSLV